MEEIFIAKLYFSFSISLHKFVYISMALNNEDIVGQDIFGQGEFCDHSAGVFCSCICGFPDSAMLDQIFRSFVLIRDNFIGNSVIIFVCHGKHVNT